ncbi:MAG: ParA family protein, partial [Candidatus Omnitrophota bacterium]
SVYDLLMGRKALKECLFQTKWENLHIIPGDIALTGGEIELVEKENRETQLKNVLAEIKEVYQYIIIDAPPSLSLLTLNVLVASDSLIVPIQCEYFALEGVSKLLQTIELVTRRLNTHLEIEGILLTMADFRTRLTLQVIEEVRQYFKDKVFNTVIPRNIKLAEAPSFGKPISHYDKECIGAKAYGSVTGELLKEKIDYEQIKGS